MSSKAFLLRRKGPVSLNAGWGYFVGLPPAEGGRQPHAEAAASPQGWPPPKSL